MIDKKQSELIDKYLRREMSPKECLYFEQEVLNNAELRKEVELTYSIKRSLIDRKRKLHKTAHWERKKKLKVTSMAIVSSIAAMFIISIFIPRPFVVSNNTNGNLIASLSLDTASNLQEKSETAIIYVKRSISKGKEEDAIAEVTRLEEHKIIPSLNDVSGGKFVMSQTMEIKDLDVLCRDAYELHWLKIQSLIAIGKTTEAVKLLKSFVQIEGKYKTAADSLLKATSVNNND